MRPTESEQRRPSRGHKHICLPFESEADYQACLDDLTKYRKRLKEMRRQHPEIFPLAIAGGFSFHDIYRSRKQKGLQLRRIKLRQTGEVFTRSEEHTSELQSHRDLPSFPTRRSSDLAIAGGFSFHDIYRSRKQKGLQLRRIKLRQTGEVFT